MGRKKRLQFTWLSSLADTHLCFLREFGRNGQLLQVDTAFGPQILTFGREALQGWFLVEVTAGGGATALSPVQQKMAMEAANLLMPIAGPMTKLAMARQLLMMMDFPGVSEILHAARQDLGIAGGGMAAPGGQAPSEDIALGDYGVGQSIRPAINAVFEGSRR